jgi:hypothetical protein
VTGSATAAWPGYKGEDAAKVAAASDYWATEAELRASLEWLGNALNMDKKPAEQLKKELEVNMKKDPRIAILTMTCVTADGTLTLQPSPKLERSSIWQRRSTTRLPTGRRRRTERATRLGPKYVEW